MTRDVYEFHVAGRIGVLSRFALPELTVGIEPACTVLTGCADGPAEIDDLLRRLAERGLIAREVLFSREHHWRGAADPAPPKVLPQDGDGQRPVPPPDVPHIPKA